MRHLPPALLFALVSFAPAKADEAPILLRPDHVFDAVATRPHAEWVVLVKGERIAAAGPAAEDPLYAKVQALARHFLRLEVVPQPLQDELVAALSLPGFVQLAVVINYYRMIVGLAIGFEFPLPEGMSDPFR